MAFIAGVYRVSGIGLNGLPTGLLGLLLRSPMIPLNFTLHVAGPITADLEDVPQECQEQNDSIQLVVLVTDQDGNPINMRPASQITMIFLAPNGVTFERPASLLTHGLDGNVQYTTVDTDLIQAGTYQLQVRYTIAGKTQTTRRGKFTVGANIEE